MRARLAGCLLALMSLVSSAPPPSETTHCRGTIVYAHADDGTGTYDRIEVLCLGPDGTYR